MNNIERIMLLEKERDLPREEMKRLLSTITAEEMEILSQAASRQRKIYFGKDVYLRGIIEFSSYCRNDCYYCGIRKSNMNARRYRLTGDTIISCADNGYDLGFRTVVLQSGEDLAYSTAEICRIVSAIRNNHPDMAVTLSIGEKSKAEYQAYFDAGAERYLLREETSSESHYRKLHPAELSLENRKRCLFDLFDIGYQVGCGFMVGSPYQTVDDIISDLCFMKALKPHMIGIGPFIHHSDTPFRNQPDGSLFDTLKLISILRLMWPDALIPATTALGTIHPKGREMGLLAGANVVMPNLSPKDFRKGYMLYDGKICTGDEAAECVSCMTRRIESTGYKVLLSRGDHPDFRKRKYE